MARFEYTVQIARPPGEVFAFVTEPVNYPRWQPSLVEVHPHGTGPLRIGREVTEVRRFLGRVMETTWICTEHRPSLRSVIESEEGPVPFRGTWELEPAGGATRFTWRLEAGGLAARAAGSLVAHATRRELAANTLRLKELLEQKRA